MAKSWNQEQLEAITTRNTNILVSASAGSGKTGVLVQRLVELVPELADSDQEITLYALYANYDKIYIDSINGDNNNSGLVADKAIKTL